MEEEARCTQVLDVVGGSPAPEDWKTHFPSTKVWIHVLMYQSEKESLQVYLFNPEASEAK